MRWRRISGMAGRGLLMMGMMALAGTAKAQSAVVFDDTKFFQVFHKADDTQSMTEFLPEGQDLKSWSRLTSIRIFPKLTEPRTAAAGLLRAVRENNPDAKSILVENPKTGDVIIDFITWPRDQSFVEFNIFRYSKKGGGLQMEQYAQRAYGNDVREFLIKLKTERQRLVNVMAKRGLKKTRK
ncbi:MAG: hypothetical protein WEB60_00380 [Terrimicrobiaceae bacterium]